MMSTQLHFKDSQVCTPCPNFQISGIWVPYPFIEVPSPLISPRMTLTFLAWRKLSEWGVILREETVRGDVSFGVDKFGLDMLTLRCLCSGAPEADRLKIDLVTIKVIVWIMGGFEHIPALCGHDSQWIHLRPFCYTFFSFPEPSSFFKPPSFLTNSYSII